MLQVPEFRGEFFEGRPGNGYRIHKFGVAIALTGLSALEGRGKVAGILAGVAYNLDEFRELASRGLSMSPAHQARKPHNSGAA